jgi:hypothetical protein
MSRTNTKAWGLSAAVLVAVVVSTLAREAQVTDGDNEATIVLLPLTGPIAAPDAELSGLAWYGDELLVFLPQYTNIDGCPSAAGCLFALARTQIESFLAGSSTGPLVPAIMPIEADQMPEIEGFEGYEAIAFYKEQAFLLVESETPDRTVAYLLRGHVDRGRGRLILDSEHVPMLTPPSSSPNLSYESLIADERGVLALPEVHGGAGNQYALRFPLDLTSVEKVPFTAVDYRLTDVTGLDPDGGFWGLNVHWPGAETQPAGLGWLPSEHAVERILRLHWNSEGVECEPSPALVLRSTPGRTQTRNWEGLVRLGDKGFLLVTDQYPSTLFGFVPYTFGT